MSNIDTLPHTTDIGLDYDPFALGYRMVWRQVNGAEQLLPMPLTLNDALRARIAELERQLRSHPNGDNRNPPNAPPQ